MICTAVFFSSMFFYVGRGVAMKREIMSKDAYKPVTLALFFCLLHPALQYGAEVCGGDTVEISR